MENQIIKFDKKKEAKDKGLQVTSTCPNHTQEIERRK